VPVGWQPIGRRCSWWPTGAAPASLIPVFAVAFHLRFLFIYFIFLHNYYHTEARKGKLSRYWSVTSAAEDDDGPRLSKGDISQLHKYV